MTHKVIVGLGFGDESKGATVDYLCATGDIRAVIRYNGGPQAAHNVVQPNGRHHTFAQFGSGTFHGVPTHLSQHMLVNPLNMVREADHLMELGLKDPFRITTVSEDALLVTPYHRAANRLREDRRGDARHGSTGQGVGETRAYEIRFGHAAPRIGDIRNVHVMEAKLGLLRDFYIEEFGADFGTDHSARVYADMYADLVGRLNIVRSEYIEHLLDSGDCVFEGAQGVLLDEDFGFHPHTTWSKTTSENALKLLEGRDAEVIGITRTYHTRHGAGPFPTEDELAKSWFPEPHNGTYEWAGAWRVGMLDLTLLNYAVRCNGGVHKIMLTHCDLFENGYLEQIYSGYDTYDSPLIMHEIGLPMSLEESERNGKLLDYVRPAGYDMWDFQSVMDGIEFATGVRPSILSYGPTWKDKKVVESQAVPA